MTLTKKEFEKTEKEIHAIFAEVEEIHTELDRIQGDWFLKWFTLGKQGRLIKKALKMLADSQKLIDKFAE